MEYSRLLFNNKIYVMKKTEMELLLDKIKNYAPVSSIYALEQFGITEVINKSYKSKSSLKRAIKQYKDKEFKVYYKE